MGWLCSRRGMPAFLRRTAIILGYLSKWGSFEIYRKPALKVLGERLERVLGLGGGACELFTCIHVGVGGKFGFLQEKYSGKK